MGTKQGSGTSAVSGFGARPVLVIGLVVAIAAAAGYWLFLRGASKAAGHGGGAGRASQMPVMPPPPTQLPMVGPAGTEPFGYPRAEPDQVGFLTLLYAKKFAQLDKYIDSLQASFEADFHKEYWPLTALTAFEVADPTLTPIVDEWVRRSPNSFAAHAARGEHLIALAWRARGSDYEIKNNRAFVDLSRQAKPELERAAQLRPRFIGAHAELMVVLSGLGRSLAQRRRVLDDALERCPECLAVRRAYLQHLEPRWGGSYAQMAAFVTETRPMVARNARLAELASFAPNDRCKLALENNQLNAAFVHCNEALNAAPHLWRALYKRAGPRRRPTSWPYRRPS